MTGRELIDWIHKNNAEDLECVVQYRDGGGGYYGIGEIMEAPSLANCERGPDAHPYDMMIDYVYGSAQNCIVF